MRTKAAEMAVLFAALGRPLAVLFAAAGGRGRLAILLAALVGPLGCGSSAGGVRVLPRYALVWRARLGEEPPTTARASAVVSFASAQIGKRYCWGGTGPSCFDCSGLAQSAWAWAGVHVPRTSQRIVETLPEVGIDEVRAGDILWWPGHVGIYAGGGWMIDALDSRHGVVVRLATDPFRAFRPVEWLEARPSLPTAYR